MPTITGGRVAFGRSVQPAQYENKKAEVELTFSIMEGEPHEAFLDFVAKEAKAKALEMVGLVAVAPGSAPKAETALTATSEAKAQAMVAGAKTPAPSGIDPTATAALKEAGKKTPKVPKAEKPAEKPQISTNPENRVEDADAALFDTPEEITSETLTTAAAAKAKKLGNGGGAKVLALRDKIVGNNTTRLSDFPVDLRRKFLDELEALT